MMLSTHFSLAEFTFSQTAVSLGIQNVPSAAQVEAMKILCRQLLEPVRAHFRKPVRITSGFRTPELCLAVGSSTGSQHARGEAADFEIAGIANPLVAAWIRDNLAFDQLILENYVRGQPNSGWIHCSYRSGRLRREVLTYSRRTYFKGLLT